MKKHSFSVYLPVCLLLLFCGTGVLFAQSLPRAERGIIEITGFPFEKRGVITLNGEWEMYWEKLLTPEDFTGAHTAPSGYIRVPGSWNSFQAGGKAVDPQSFGTYRLRVSIGEHAGKKFALSFPEIVNPARIWIEGKPVRAKTEEEFEREKRKRTDYLPFTYVFTPASPVIEIIVQMHNTNHLRGGLRETIFFGFGEALSERQLTRTHMEVFLAGILFIMSLYHIALYFLRRRHPANLFFALLCFFIFIRTGVTGENIFLTHFPALPLVPQLKLEALSFFLAVPAGFLFIASFFSGHVNRRVVIAVTAVLAVFPLIVIASSPFTYPRVLISFQLLTVCVGLYCFFIMFRAYRRRKREVLLLLSAWTVMFICSVNDILYTNNVTEFAGYLLPVGMAHFIFTHSFIISMDFARAFRETKELGRKLEENNILLEDKVVARTAELTEKNSQLEEKRKLEAMDMEIAATVQSSVMPRVPPDTPGWEMALHYQPMSGVSGDFYDFYTPDDRFLGAGIFDVSGHGISSGLVTMLAKWMVFKAFMGNQTKPLGDVFAALADTLPEAIGSTSFFITGILVKIEGNSVQYANAGHPDLYHLHGGSARAIRNPDGSSVSGTLLGIEHIRSSYRTLTVAVEKNDCLVLITDGITEAENEAREQYGDERFIQALEAGYGRSPREIIDFLLDDISRFRGKASVNDDITVIIMKKL